MKFFCNYNIYTFVNRFFLFFLHKLFSYIFEIPIIFEITSKTTSLFIVVVEIVVAYRLQEFEIC